jgi:NRPS condensation-like uncharacterized protein
MSSLDYTKVLDLLARSNEHGLEISNNDEELSIKFPKGKAIDPEFLEELKSCKAHLIEYFRICHIDHNALNEWDPHAHVVLHEGRDYYRITSVQVYWVDDNEHTEYKQTDKVHGILFESWDLLGRVDPAILDAAVAYLVRRHESLRSTFHFINGEYLMRVEDEDSPEYRLELIDLRGASIEDAEIEKLATFDGHRFNFETGPLFKARLVQIDKEKFILSIKLHHVISDAWSKEILLRDLMVAYRDLTEKKQPDLPVLTCQLKDYLALINHDIRKNYDRDKSYWNSLYPYLPETLIIPGAKKTGSKQQEKICRIEAFSVPPEILNRLATMAKEFAVSIFIILQATFKAFLRHRTGQTDIVIGTYVFGRDYPGAEDQIGCYAKTVLIRTALDPGDSFRTIVGKVRKANEDMQTFKAYPLIDAIEAMLPDKRDLSVSVWKINIQYDDVYNPYVTEDHSLGALFEKQGITVIPKEPERNSHLFLDMHLVFQRSDKEMDLAVHYDGSSFDPSAIRDLIADYSAYTMQIAL